MTGDEDVQRLVTQITRETAAWLARSVLPRLEEHWADPAVRWQRLKEALRRYAEGEGER